MKIFMPYVMIGLIIIGVVGLIVLFDLILDLNYANLYSVLLTGALLGVTIKLASNWLLKKDR